MKVHKSIQYGVPLVLFCIAGMYGLQQFVDMKVERMDKKVVKQSERRFELEEEHRRTLAKLSGQPFEIKPIPRAPDDESAR